MYRNLCLILFCLSARVAPAQVNEGVQISHYIFDSFSKGTVLLKTGELQEHRMNYNSLTSEMVFDENGKYLAFSNPEQVDTVTIHGRKFVPVNKQFYEVLTHTKAPLFMEYSCTIKDPGANLGYGMSSTTAAATPLKSLIQSGGAYELKLPDGYQPIPKSGFLIFKDGKFWPANTPRQLSAIFPDKKAWIGQYMKDKHTDLRKQEDLITLVQELQN